MSGAVVLLGGAFGAHAVAEVEPGCACEIVAFVGGECLVAIDYESVPDNDVCHGVEREEP